MSDPSPPPAPRRRWLRSLACLLVPVLAGCVATDPADPAAVAAAEVVLLGDSMLAENRGASRDVGARLADVLGRPVANRAVPGAAVLDGAIPGQHLAGDHAWVVLQGGANDLVRRCDDDARAVVDALVGPDGRSGALAGLAARLAADGHRVALLGYHRVQPDARFYSGCGEAFDLLDQRLGALAATDPALVFVPARDAFDVADPGWYAQDGYHPSPRGSARLAGLLADAITAAETA